MKLFNKKNKDDFGIGASEIINDETANIISKLGTSDIEFESMKSAKANKPSARSNQAIDPTAAKTTTSSGQFGIKDAISLINSLPKKNIETIIPVVIKTLESAHIKLEAVLEDANQHENVLDTRNESLATNIKNLESKLNNMNEQVLALNTELEEISKAKTLLAMSHQAK